MRRDWDYVEFADYQRDMDVLGQTAGAAIDHLRRQLNEANAVIWAMVRVTGGRIEIPKPWRRPLEQGCRIELNDYNDTITFLIDKDPPREPARG